MSPGTFLQLFFGQYILPNSEKECDITGCSDEIYNCFPGSFKFAVLCHIVLISHG